MPLNLRIVTPEREVFSDFVDVAVIPGVEGELGILPMHVPLVTTLNPGELSYRKDGKEYHLAVGIGLMELSDDRVSLLTDLAVSDEEIDEKETEAALESARRLQAEQGSDTNPEEIASVQASIQKSLAQLKVKRRRRTTL